MAGVEATSPAMGSSPEREGRGEGKEERCARGAPRGAWMGRGW
jgi:hypothetical protein